MSNGNNHSPLNILLIDDDEDDFIITRDLLAELPANRYKLHWRDTYSAGKDAITRGEFDVYLVDYRLGAHSGLDLLHDAQKCGNNAPFILLTGQGDTTVDEKAMQAGAADYLLKSELNPALLDRVIRYSLAQKRVEAHLRASEERYRQFFEDDLTGDFIATLDGKIIACNTAFLNIFGFPSQKEAIGFDIHRLCPQKDFTWEQAVTAIAAGKKITYMETELKRLDSRTVYVVQNLIGIFDADGALFRIKGYVFNNTERKLLEQQLLQSQKMEAIGRLAGGVAHDFNNHLTAILSYAGLARDALPEDSPVQHDLAGIQQAAKSAATLTRQLLAFARKQRIQPQVLNLADSVSKLEKMLRRIIGENIELVTLRNNDTGLVEIDPGHIEQILMNLVVNARDAMPYGGKIIIQTQNVSLDKHFSYFHPEIPPGEYVLLSISDNGIGISAEDQKHLFEPFFTTKEIGKGTGLGLATVFGIVRQNEGHILVYSEVGVGTTFKLYFPRKDRRDAAPTASANAMEFPRGDETILVVEDDEVVRDLISRVLEEAGYTILTAGNGQQAMEVMRSTGTPHIDLVISDAIMPVEDGATLFRQLQQHDPDLRILFMSGYADSTEVVVNILKTGMPFMEKPFSPLVLAQRVREILDKS